MATKKPIGVIGLGLMGTAISERLLEHGYRVLVWNRTREKADRLIAHGAAWSDNPLRGCDRVIVSLYSSDVVGQVIGQMQADLRGGQVIIDTTTGEPEDALALAERMAALRVGYLDAPISGSSEQTRRGEATVMVGGEEAAFAACDDLWQILGKTTFYVGPSGSASKMKLVSNLVLGLNRVALAEGLAFAQAIGVEPKAALPILQASPAYSRAMDVKGHKMLNGDFSLQARLSQHLKDVRIILDEAAAAGLELPMSKTHRRLLEQAEAAGYGDLDNSAIIKVYREPQDA